MITTFEEETDRPLPEYPLPEQIERLIEAGKYSNVENRVTKVCLHVITKSDSTTFFPIDEQGY